MSVAYIDNLPGFSDGDADSPSYRLNLCIRGPSAFVRSPKFIARIDLETAKVKWLVERTPASPFSKIAPPRAIEQWGLNLWVARGLPYVAELLPTEQCELAVHCRNADSGELLWEQRVSIPSAADWAEKTPAWPGAPTEHIYGFLADNPQHLVVCLSRHSRMSGCSSPSQGIHVMTFPPRAFQTDAYRFEPGNGAVAWRATHDNFFVGIMERRCFRGEWTDGSRLAILDFKSGTNTIFHRSPNQLGWPVRLGSNVAVPWHSKEQVGVDWIDNEGRKIGSVAWHQAGVRSTMLHATDSGLAFQANDQLVWWLGNERAPLWNVRAKPYIYHVHRAHATDVFVGTDGNGGRLFGHDAASGQETLNLKPALGGFGSLAKIPGHDVLVSAFTTSRNYKVAPRLFVMSMKNLRHHLDIPCWTLLGTWEHGALCLSGENRERLAIVDVRSMDR